VGYFTPIEKWSSKHVEKNIKDGRAKALVIDKTPIPKIPSSVL
jgi:hypothetical protein